MNTPGYSQNIKQEYSNVLVFGGSGIIGRAIAQEFGNQGWSVGVHYHRNRSSAEETATMIKKTKAVVRLYQANVDCPSQISTLLQSFLQDFEFLTLLVWAVGIAPAKLLAKTTSDDWEQTLQTNLTGAYHVFKHAAPIFEQQRAGAVILIGSLSSEQGCTGQAAYAASKSGLMGLMRSTAREWAHWNVRVNAIFPGWHPSPLSNPGIHSALAEHTHLLNRTPCLHSVAANVFHLASTQDMSGQIWNLDSRIW